MEKAAIPPKHPAVTIIVLMEEVRPYVWILCTICINMQLYSKMVHAPCQLVNQISSCLNSCLLKHLLRQPQFQIAQEKNTTLNTQIAQI